MTPVGNFPTKRSVEMILTNTALLSYISNIVELRMFNDCIKLLYRFGTYD